eukprot:6983806-Pyramimonas_sp.AAC.1
MQPVTGRCAKQRKSSKHAFPGAMFAWIGNLAPFLLTNAGGRAQFCAHEISPAPPPSPRCNAAPHFVSCARPPRR